VSQSEKRKEKGGVSTPKALMIEEERTQQLTSNLDHWNPFRSERTIVEDYCLTILEGPHKGQVIPIEQTVTEIGRDSYLHVPLSQDRQVSKLHCELMLEPRGIRLRDTGSLNGVYVQEMRVLDAYLTPGMTFRVGKSLIQLQDTKRQREIRTDYFDASGQLVGRSPKMQRIFSLLSRLRNMDLSVLLTGETGTGKTSIARALHEQSNLREGPFVAVNCAAIPPELVEAEFFGHEPGAFTGASSQTRKGYVEQANGGTLFLDEIGELSLGLQAKLLYAIEEKRIRRLGGSRDIQVDMRVVSATHCNLRQEIKENRFREDLFYRLAVVEVEVPPLRERIEDLKLLTEILLSKISPSQRIFLNADAERKLRNYSFPGNIRELRNLLERAVAFLEQPFLEAEHLHLPDLEEMTPAPSAEKSTVLNSILPPDEQNLPLKRILEECEKQALLRALRQTHWNVSKASQLLEVHRSWSYALIKKHNLKQFKE
jgi:DNA-binding NtrC family response regulator